jgi:translation initiation factor IF-1
MSKQNVLTVEGVILEALGNSIFRTQLNNGHIIITHLSGKIRMHSIQILTGDKVLVEMSPYDLTKGRVTRRLTQAKKFEKPE